MMMNSIENNVAENLLIKNSVSQKTTNGVVSLASDSTITSANTSAAITMLQRHKAYHNLNHDDVNSIRGFAFESCKEYLGGVWKNIRNNQFQIEKIS